MTRPYSLLSLTLAALFFVSTASAFDALSPLRRWFATREVIVDNSGVASVSDGDGGVTATLGAVQVWNGAGAGTIVTATPDSIPTNANDIIAPGSPSYLVFGDPFNICKGSCLAATLTGFYDNSSKRLCGGQVVVEISDSDIVFNLRNNFTSEDELGSCTSFPPKQAEYSLEAVAAHEVGHLIGLGHTPVSDALMSASVGPCDGSLLHSDDIEGADSLYACSLSECAADESAFCSDGIDNDCDGVKDSGDPDCGGGPACGNGSCETGEDSCSCALDCGGPVSEAPLFCSDGQDNDCDDLTDCADNDCANDDACSTSCGGNKTFCDENSACCSGNCKNGRCRGN